MTQKIAFISTYPPRRCGIGTFTENLFQHVIDSQEKVEGYIIAIDNSEEKLDYPAEVTSIIRQDERPDYIKAANDINSSDTNVCVLQHEFGIFGGESGSYILSLMYELTIPVVVTLHTVLKTPSINEKVILQKICKRADKVVVMSRHAVKFLKTIYGVDKHKIEFIQHGVPQFNFEREKIKEELQLSDKKIILTFGFLGRNKGIETAIESLPKVVAKHPNILYIVLGRTHPDVVKHAGEEYRVYLQNLIEKLELTEHVILLNKFVSEEELFKYLHASDLYVTPYLNEAQITSGTLSYAVGSGLAVLSTPYWHAQELLADDRGVLFDFNDSEALSNCLVELLDNPNHLKKIQDKADNYGKKITWAKSGQKYRSLLIELGKANLQYITEYDIPTLIKTLPPFELDHLYRLTDDTGLIQHAKFGVANRKEGYCLDDNARALLLSLMVYQQNPSEPLLRAMSTYLSYIHYVQNEDGTFRNFVSYNRTYLDEIGSDDSFGRTIWALGYLLSNAPNYSFHQLGERLFFDSVPHFKKCKSIRAIAKIIIGLCHYLSKNMADIAQIENVKSLTSTLVHEYNKNKSNDWKWFEPILAYDNAMLPYALLFAADILGDNELKEIGIETMDFLLNITFSKGYLSVVGNEKWFVKNSERSRFAQQPIDVMATILMLQQAFLMTQQSKYLDKIFISFYWFFGENDIKMPLYDRQTKGCCDGIEHYGVNRNQGAESTLAYLISRCICNQVANIKL